MGKPLLVKMDKLTKNRLKNLWHMHGGGKSRGSPIKYSNLIFTPRPYLFMDVSAVPRDKHIASVAD